MGETTSEPDSGQRPAPAAASVTDLDDLIWNPISTATMARAHPQFDELVLDAYAGDGASALPTAELVGIGGLVDAIDPSAELIEIARERAGERMPQLRLHVADPATWEMTGYDLVQCVLGVTSFEDLDAGVRHLIERARPGGRMAITVWAPGALEPLQELLAAALPGADTADDADASDEASGETSDDEASGDATPGDEPAADEPFADEPVDDRSGDDAPTPLVSEADVLHSPGSLAHWLTGFGLVGVRAETVQRHLDLTDELAWSAVLGTRLRDALGDLDADGIAAVRERLLAMLADRGATSVDLTTLIAVGQRSEE